MPALISKDFLRSCVEAASGGLCSVIYDDGGLPNYMRRIPKIRIEDLYPELGLNGVHPAFIVNGEEKDEIWIGQYPAALVDDIPVSLPAVIPDSASFDEAMTYCQKKGPGWHLMTNAEWALLGALALKNGFTPRGNTAYGKSHAAGHETGTSRDGKTLAGSGPVSWRHDDSPTGISDLVGNVWEWAAGLRISNGEIQIIKDNDAADASCDMSASSVAWQAILADVNLTLPGSANTLKLDATGEKGADGIALNTKISSQSAGTNRAACAFSGLTAKSGVNIPDLLKLLSLYPMDGAIQTGELAQINSGERMALRGGCYNSQDDAGLFALNLCNERETRMESAGFRVAFVV